MLVVVASNYLCGGETIYTISDCCWLSLDLYLESVSVVSTKMKRAVLCY